MFKTFAIVLSFQFWSNALQKGTGNPFPLNTNGYPKQNIQLKQFNVDVCLCIWFEENPILMDKQSPGK